ncbi:MAG: response regulator [Beijerinckiaceae bacterium]|nr:response regulator [Beijerinckiaceae bacterium]MCI0735593.1 response regulator [Beijerinckiaceae bacterium]
MSEQLAYAALRRIRRSGNIALIATFNLLLAAIAAAFSFLSAEQGFILALGAGAFFAIAGVCGSFAFAAGLCQFSGQTARNGLTRLICDGSGEGLIVTGAGGRAVYANEAYLTLAGARGLSEVRTVERLFSGSPEGSEVSYRLAQAEREGSSAAEEMRISPPLSGASEAGWYRIKVKPLPFRGISRASLWSVTDITRERQHQEDVFQELRQAIDFLDQSPAGFFSCSQSGDVTYMNTTLTAWLGYEAAEAEAGHLKVADIASGEVAALIASVSGSTGDVRTEHFDVPLKCRDGQSLPARLIHRVSFGLDGRAQASRTLVLKRSSTETAGLGGGGEPFARVFDAMPMAVAILDKSGRIQHWNAAFARLMPEALKPAGDTTCSIYSGIQDRDHAAFDTSLAAAFRSALNIRPADVSLTGEGERSARLFFAGANERNGTGTTVYALDTTEQRALQSNVAQSHKMHAIGQLAGGVAHDFNNVLTAIIGHCDLLLANHRPTDPSFRDINQIKQNANRAASLVRQLLAYSRRQTLRPQVLQLGGVLSDLQMMVLRLVGEKISLELRHGRDLWPVKADLNQFEQVLINLIVNARDAMPQGGKIILRTRNVLAGDSGSFSEPSLVPADYVAIEVEDFGHGIPPEAKDKIFEPFFTTKEVGKGTGLGLSMVYGIVKQTGGYVFCASTVGKGTVFTILLPRHIPGESYSFRSDERVSSPAADLTGHGTILLVEDEEAVRAFGARALASRGYTVLQAASGIEALQIVEQNGGKIDLVISDVVMPEMDGPTMFSELRRRGVNARVIFVSGYAEDAFAKNLPEGGDFGFLPKPFSLKQLIEAVKGNRYTPAA